VAVKCRIEPKPRLLRKVVSSGGECCSADIPERCSTKKVSAGRKLCAYGASEFRELVNSTSGAALPSFAVIVNELERKNSQNSVATNVDSREEQMLIEQR